MGTIKIMVDEFCLVDTVSANAEPGWVIYQSATMIGDFWLLLINHNWSMNQQYLTIYLQS